MRSAGEDLLRELFPDVVGVMVDRAAEFAVDFMACRDEKLQARRLSQRWFYPRTRFISGGAMNWKEVQSAVYQDGHVASGELDGQTRVDILAAAGSQLCHTNNKTVCDQMNYLIQNKTISHATLESLHLVALCERFVFAETRVWVWPVSAVQRIPSHVCETLRISAITEELARSRNTTCLGIACNRAADRHAKQVFSQRSRARVDSLIQHVLTWLFWLSKLNASLYVPVEERNTVEPVSQTFALLDPRSPIEQFTNAFPRWNWSYDGFNFDWATAYEPFDKCRLPAWKVAIQSVVSQFVSLSVGQLVS